MGRSACSKLLLTVGALLALAGCATVPQYQRGRLADPLMDFERTAAAERREMKWLEAREGSTGGAGGAGGGCACN